MGVSKIHLFLPVEKGCAEHPFSLVGYNNDMVYYLSIINVFAFLAYAGDKFLAVHKKYRIPEKMLLSIAFLGGGMGALLAMRLFRHKTNKTIFMYTIPLSVFLWIVALYLLK